MLCNPNIDKKFYQTNRNQGNFYSVHSANTTVFPIERSSDKYHYTSSSYVCVYDVSKHNKYLYLYI